MGICAITMPMGKYYGHGCLNLAKAPNGFGLYTHSWDGCIFCIFFWSWIIVNNTSTYHYAWLIPPITVGVYAYVLIIKVASFSLLACNHYALPLTLSQWSSYGSHIPCILRSSNMSFSHTRFWSALTLIDSQWNDNRWSRSSLLFVCKALTPFYIGWCWLHNAVGINTCMSLATSLMSPLICFQLCRLGGTLFVYLMWLPMHYIWWGIM